MEAWSLFQAPIMKKTKTLFLTWKRFIIDENIISSIQKEKKDTLDDASSTPFFFH
jgi:hypothetical protein